MSAGLSQERSNYAPTEVTKDVLFNLSVIEEYRIRASWPDIYAMSARQQSGAEFTAKNILTRLSPSEGATLVDIGCGEGTLLRLASSLITNGRLVGILPTAEEIDRAQNHLRNSRVSLRKGLAHATDLPDGCADHVVCNNVLHMTANPELGLKEIARIAKEGALIFVGEIPFKQEGAGGRYKSKPFRALASALKHGGLSSFLSTVRYIGHEGLSGRWSSMGQKRIFWAGPAQFSGIAARYGLRSIETFQHLQLNADGAIEQSPTRMNYLFCRMGLINSIRDEPPA